jgi:Zn-dependent peptidase ImmA (M78 family)
VNGDPPAELILKRLGITEPQELDLEAIAWDLGVRIRYRPLDGCEARIIGTTDKAIIIVNIRSPRRRRRFSIGHELGHWHHDRGRVLVCLAEEIGRVGTGALSRERAADRFASSLFMPDYILRPIARAYPKADFQPADSGGSRPRIRDDVAHHSDLISPGVPR